MNNLRTKTYNALRKSEKYFKTDMVYLAKGGSWLTLGQTTSAIITFSLAVAYANFLPKEAYGTYKYVLSVAGILGAFTLTGMGTTVARSVALGFEGVLKSAFWTKLRWSIFMVLASFFFAVYYFINENYTLAISLLIIGSFSPIIQSASIYDPFLNGKKEFKIKSIYGIFKSLIPSMLILITIILTNNPIILILVYFISSAVINFYFYLRIIKKFKPNKEINKNAISYGKHLSVMNILGTIAGNLDKILMWHFLGPTQLAIYSFALAIPNQLKGVFKNIPVLAFPKFSEKPIDDIKKTLLPKIIKFVLIISGIVVIYIIAAKFIYGIFFPQYTEAILYSQLFALTIIFTPNSLIRTAITAHSQTRKLYFLSFTMPSIKILLLLTLLPIYGILGAIVAIAITELIRTIILLYLLKKM